MLYANRRRNTAPLRGLIIAAILLIAVPGGERGLPRGAYAADDMPLSPQIVVTLKAGTTIAAFNAAHGARTVQGLPDSHTYIVAVPGANNIQTLIAGWQHDPTVASAQSNEPIDLLAAEQFYLAFDQFYLAFDGTAFPAKAQNQWALATVREPAAQHISTGQGSTVAVLDTGVETTHPALAGHLITGGYDAVSHTTTISDVVGGSATGHGTFVAGMIAQVAPQARILPFRVLDSSGRGTIGDVAAAIEAAANHGATVINLSMGTITSSVALQNAVIYAQMRGAVVVASAGNRNSSAPQYPAAWPGVVAVAGTAQGDVRAPFSSFGPWVTVSAPAVKLYSTYPGGYAIGSGTSFAAPMVAGAIALMRSLHRGAEPSTIVDGLRQSCVSLEASNPVYAGLLGDGRIDLQWAVSAPLPL